MDRQQPETVLQAHEFLGALTELSLKHGIAITGAPVLFVMEPEDRQFAYRMDEESRITLG